MGTASMMHPPSDALFFAQRRARKASDKRLTAAEAQGSRGRRKVPSRKRRQVRGSRMGTNLIREMGLMGFLSRLVYQQYLHSF